MALNALRELAEHPVALGSHAGLAALMNIRARRVLEAMRRSREPAAALSNV
jgi:hypothetical protein